MRLGTDSTADDVGRIILKIKETRKNGGEERRKKRQVNALSG